MENNEAISTLEAMGFERASIDLAVKQTGSNNIEVISTQYLGSHYVLGTTPKWKREHSITEWWSSSRRTNLRTTRNINLKFGQLRTRRNLAITWTFKNCV